MDSGSEAKDAGAKAILTPKFVRASQTRSAFPVAYESKVGVVLEWDLTDLTGNTVWVDTVTGEGRITDYAAFDQVGKRRRLFEAMLSDLFYRSRRAMVSASAIRKFAARPR